MSKDITLHRRSIERALAHLIPLIVLIRAVYFWIVRPITIGVRTIVVRGDDILLVRGHGRSFWHLPGGGVKRGETLAQAAVREVHEETGWDIEIEQLQGMYSNFSERKSDHTAIFVCRPVRPHPFRLNIEIFEASFFPIDALPRCSKDTYRRVLEFQQGLSGIHGRW